MDPGKGSPQDASKFKGWKQKQIQKRPSLYAAMGIQRHTITVSFTHSFAKHLQSACCYDTNRKLRGTISSGRGPRAVRPTRWQKCSRRDQGDRGESMFQTQWPWTEVSKNVGDSLRAWRHDTSRVTSLLSLYTLVLLQRGCVPSLLFRHAFTKQFLPGAPSHAAPPAWSLVAPAPLQACGLPSSSGFHRQPPRPQRPARFCSLASHSAPDNLAPQPPAWLQAGPLQHGPGPESSTLYSIACLLTAPGICSKPSHLPPETPAVWLPPGSLFPYIPSPPALPNSLSRPSLWLRSQMWHLIAKETLPCEGQLLFTHKGGGWATFPGGMTSALCLPTLLFRGMHLLPEGSAGLGRHPVTPGNEHRSIPANTDVDPTQDWRIRHLKNFTQPWMLVILINWN